MRILLDSVVFIFALSALPRLSQKARAVLDNDEDLLEMSPISLSEIAIKSRLGKLDLSAERVRAGMVDLKVRSLPFTAEHAYRMFNLHLYHSDPFDRQIIAQALSEDIPILTSDVKFKLYKGLKVIW